MTGYKCEILQTLLFFGNERNRWGEGEGAEWLEIKMCGNVNYCEIVCQLFRASLLLMDLAAVCWKTRIVLIRM